MTVRKIKTQTRDALSEYLSQFKFLQRSYSICPHLRTLPINMSAQRRVCSKLKPGLVTNSFYDKSSQQIKWHTASGLYSACWKEVLNSGKALILVSRKMQFGVKSVGNKQLNRQNWWKNCKTGRYSTSHETRRCVRIRVELFNGTQKVRRLSAAWRRSREQTVITWHLDPAKYYQSCHIHTDNLILIINITNEDLHSF